MIPAWHPDDVIVISCLQTGDKMSLNDINFGESETYNTLMEKELPKTEWIVEDIIPAKKLILIGGARRSYKSWLALNLFACISSGETFLGRKTQKLNCLYLDGENNKYTDVERLKRIEKGGLKRCQNESRIWDYPPLKLNEPSHIVKLGEFCKRHEIKVIFVDTIRRLFNGKENDAETMSLLLNDRIKKELIEQYGLTVIIIHHTKKSNDNDDYDILELLRGSSELANVPDGIFFIERENKSEIAVFRNEKSKYGKELKDITLYFHFDDVNNSLKIELSNQSVLELTKYSDIVQILYDFIKELEKNKKKEFETKDPKNFYFEKTGKIANPTSMNNSLKILVRESIIRKKSHGHWEITNELQF